VWGSNALHGKWFGTYGASCTEPDTLFN